MFTFEFNLRIEGIYTVFHVYQVHFKRLSIASSGCSFVIVVEPGKLLPPAIYLVWCLKLQDSFKKPKYLIDKPSSIVTCIHHPFCSPCIRLCKVRNGKTSFISSTRINNLWICWCWLWSNLCLIVSQYFRTRGKSFFTESVHQQASSILSNIGTWRQISNRKGQVKNIWGQRLDFVYYQKYHNRFSARV